MTIDNIYLHVMVAAASCMLITGLLLALVKSPSDGRASKFRAAKYALTVSVLVLGSLNLVQLSFDSSGSVSFLGPCIALAVGYLQSMLFTMALLVLIRPEEVTFRVVIIQLGVILVAASLLVGAFFLLPRATFLYVYELGIVAYLLQLAFYIHWFRRCRRVFLNHIRQYYEEDEIERSMWWVYIIFWAALAVGLLSLLMMFNHRVIDMCLTVALAVFCTLLAACFINYGLTAPIILPAIYSPAEDSSPAGEEAPSSPQPLAKKPVARKTAAPKQSKLELWIANKGYLDNELAVADIAAKVDMTVDQLHRYFREVVGEEFRTWRVRRRIDEAKQLMAEHPELPTTQIGKLCGFNDRSFFYQQFLRFTNESVADYRQRLNP